MRPRVECSIGDDAMEDCGFLKYSDDKLKSSFLETMSALRKNRLFCDVVLNVGNTDIHAHKNVLACVSPHFMEMFSAEEKKHNGHVETSIPSYIMNGGITRNALQLLVDYAYTATLEVPDGLVKEVYIAASKLRMDRVIKECARHLIADLCPDTCIEIRSLPGIIKNKDFVLELDTYLAKEFIAVAETTGFLNLPCVNIDVLYQTKQEMSVVTHESLCRLVLDWIRRQMCDESLNMDMLLERAHLLYLALDNSLQDCSDFPISLEKESELIQDYKKMVLKCPNNKARRKCLAAPVRPRVLIYSREIGEAQDEKNQESDWRLLASAKVGQTTFVSLVTLNGQLTRISIQIRLNVPASPSPSHEIEVMSSSTKSNDTEDEAEPELFCEVAPMSGPKCGLGVAELNGKLLVCGGYDRGDCLKHVESYCPDKNVWTLVSNMLEARGRVQIAVLDDKVYAVGGSNGSTELDTVECWQEHDQKWKKKCKLPLARSSSGVCALNNKIYCVGGWNGQSGIKQCDVYLPLEDKWSSISSLNTGRYQAGVAAWNGKLWAVGGSDAWNCLSSVEVYDPETDQWTFATPLLSVRRGCGLAPYNGKLYVVGGSDGTHSLSTTEVYDEETKTWTLGPSLSTPRSNVSVVVVKDRLYAIGGFSGKIFLKTMEFLDPNTNEWTTFVPQTANGVNGNGHIESIDSDVDETMTITTIRETAQVLVDVEEKLKNLQMEATTEHNGTGATSESTTN